MIQSQFTDIKIVGMSTAVPKNKEVISEVFNERFGPEAVANFSKTTGVYERRVALPEQTASDLAFVAAEYLIGEKGIDKHEIGICIFVTQTPDYNIPATACVLHKRLGLQKNCIAFDINLGCSGYVYGLQVVSSLMETTNCKLGLLLVGDTSNKRGLYGTGIGPNDASAVMLFGEGGSATLLEKKEGSPKITTAYRTDGEGFKAIITPAGRARKPVASFERVKWADGNERSDYDLYMNGVDVFTFSINEVPQMINEFVEANQMDKDSFDCFAFHQANAFIFKQLIKRAKLPKDKLHITLDRYGNTSVTSIPLTVCDMFGDENNGRDRAIFSCGFGIGLSWGIATFMINENDILPIIETDDYYKDGGVSRD
jgi:3-oxoacyl-[acyl-carrier-protein] synthase-3